MIYLRFFWTVLKHKFFVLIAGVVLKVPLWQLIVHDLSKFSREEFGPYARRFGRGTAGGLDHDVEPQEWKDAWEHHWQTNPHHWEFYVWYFGDMEPTPEPMPEQYIREMVADWAGAGRAYTGRWDLAEWWEKTGDQKVLHRDTRWRVEQLITEWNYRSAKLPKWL